MESNPEYENQKYQKKQKPVVVHARRTGVEETIETLEGVMTANPGDWIITGIKGEKYPCKDDIFRATYEPYSAMDDIVERR